MLEFLGDQDDNCCKESPRKRSDAFDGELFHVKHATLGACPVLGKILSGHHANRLKQSFEKRTNIFMSSLMLSNPAEMQLTTATTSGKSV